MSLTIKAAILALKARVADAFAAVEAKGGTLPATQDTANLPAAIASIPSGGFDMDGFVYETGYEPTKAGELVNIMLPHIKEINNSSITVLQRLFLATNATVERVVMTGIRNTNDVPAIGVIDSSVLANCSNLKYISIPNLTELHTICDHAFSFNDNLLELHLPKVGFVAGNRQFSENPKLRICDLTMCSRLAVAYHFIRDYDLIDLRIGAGMTNSFVINYWSPTNALDANSQSLLTAEDIAAGFTSNLEKLLYNIREHIAANLPAAPNTIAFSAAVKAAILADQPTADAFTNKNWTIA